VELTLIRLSLFRHAKSDWDSEAASDFDRPLASRGLAAAPLMGDYFRSRAYLPDLVYCSAARRTQQTFHLAFPDSEFQPQVRFETKLYLAEPKRILHMVRSTSSEVSITRDAEPDTREIPIRHVMIIGHNPGLQAFALGMIDKSSKHPQTRNARKTINQKLPTAAFVLVEFETDSWSEVAPGTGILLDYMTPKLLADANNI